MAAPEYTEADYAEIIALSEDPDVSFDDVEGRPFSPEEKVWLEEFADALFFQCSLEKQVTDICGMPIAVSVRRLSKMTGPQRAEILSVYPKVSPTDSASCYRSGLMTAPTVLESALRQFTKDDIYAVLFSPVRKRNDFPRRGISAVDGLTPRRHPPRRSKRLSAQTSSTFARSLRFYVTQT